MSDKKKYLDPNKPYRNKKRLDYHQYGKARRGWSEMDLLRFQELNGRGADDVYINKDWEVAKALQTTLASVQYLRRKVNLVSRAWAESQSNRDILSRYSQLELMQMSEESLKKLVGLKR